MRCITNIWTAMLPCSCCTIHLTIQCCSRCNSVTTAAMFELSPPEALLEELGDLVDMTFAMLLHNYEKQLRNIALTAQDEFAEFLPHLFHRIIELITAYQLQLKKLHVKPSCFWLFNTHYLKQIMWANVYLHWSSVWEDMCAACSSHSLACTPLLWGKSLGPSSCLIAAARRVWTAMNQHFMAQLQLWVTVQHNYGLSWLAHTTKLGAEWEHSQHKLLLSKEWPAALTPWSGV